MRDFTIVTDSSCDLPAEVAAKYGLIVAPLMVTIDGKTYKNELDGRELGFKQYYRLLRDGKRGSTSAVNIDEFVNLMEPELKAGRDILYLGFSSGLSATYQNGAAAIQELSERYPEAKMYAVDTLCASLGEGMMVYLAAREKNNGSTIEEVRDYVEKMKLKLCHWFTVDDLNHLRRGGRISSATAIIGTMLSIKPVLHVDDAGHLINMEKARGRGASIRRLAAKLAETAIDPDAQTVFISHGDCEEDARGLANIVKSVSGVRDVIINYVGPVIGAHSGPGTLALFFVGEKR